MQGLLLPGHGCTFRHLALQKQLSLLLLRRQVVDMTAGSTLGDLAGSIGPTSFVGYSQLEARGTVVALLQGGRPVDSVSAGDVSDGSTVLPV